MAQSAFVEAALKILATRKGDLTCTVEGGRRATLREAWPVSQLQLWERTEGKEVTGIDTMVHWRSYVFGE